jgi:DNA-3-methyladenine glycosylase II
MTSAVADPTAREFLRRAVERVYGFDHLPTEDEMVQVAERWRPYRSLAVSYLFASEFEKGT